MSRSLSQEVRRFPQLLAAPAVAGVLFLLPMSSARAQEWSFNDAQEENTLVKNILAGTIGTFFGGGVVYFGILDWFINACQGKKTNRKLLKDINSQVNTINGTLAKNGKINDAIVRIESSDVSSKVNTINRTLAENGKIKSAIGRIEEKLDELKT